MKHIFAICFAIGISSAAIAQKGFEDKEKRENSSGQKPFVYKTINGKYRKLPGEPGRNFSGSTFKKQQSDASADQAVSDMEVRIHFRNKEGLPKLIEVKRSGNNQRASITGRNDEFAALDFIGEIKHHLKIQKNVSFRFNKSEGGIVRLYQFYKGLEVSGSEVLVHLDQYGRGKVFTGNYSSCDFNTDTTFIISGKQAIEIVTDELRQKTIVQDLSENEKAFYKYNGPSIKKVIYENKGNTKTIHLAYEIEIKPNSLENWFFVIDGKNGEVLKFYSKHCTAGTPSVATAADLKGISRTINTFLENSKYYLIDASKPMYKAQSGTGIIITYDSHNTPGTSGDKVVSANNTWTNANAVSAHYNASTAYNYFYTNHGRNSINGQGGNIYSFVNVSDEDGTSLANAYWNGEAMFYGNGGEYFLPLARGIDVGGHEMTHGVVQNTANLEYEGESGAINESMADCFGAMMDPEDWKLGEDVVKTEYYPSGALRDMADPHQGLSGFNENGYQPKHVNEQYRGLGDNGGVHTNSGIPNHAFYLIATGTSRKKAADIFYRALSMYLTRSSQFVDLRIACMASAKDLFGETSAEYSKVVQAFDAVGITGEQPTDNTDKLPVNPGGEYMLFLSTYEGDPNSIYLKESATGKETPVAEIEPISKPSISDDGSYGTYIDINHRIHVIDLEDISNPLDEILMEDTIWSNVAISKDGEKIAYITNDKDTSIYVYDSNSDEIVRFYLYNPTYTEGVKSAGPVYADAVEWDYTGEYLVYDCFNQIKSNNGEDIEYWDVNFIRVWDNERKTFADGEIQKLFASLPEGVSIGNPSFSKTSPDILAFDVEDLSDTTYRVVAHNIETNISETVYYNVTLGFPSYSKSDDKIAFTTYDIQTGAELIGVVPVQADKQTPADDPYVYVEYAEKPVFFATGERTLGLPDNLQNELPLINIFPNPSDDIINIRSTANIENISVFDSQGRRVMHNINSSIIDISTLPSGLYLVDAMTDKGRSEVKFLKR
jgi:bacillolysin